MTDKLRRIYALVGELSTKLSEVELGWYRIFSCLMHQTPGVIRDAIINTQRTGDGQRQIVMATAKAVYPDENSEAMKFIKALKEQTDNLAGRRNAAIHSIIDLDYGLPPSTFFGPVGRVMLMRSGWREPEVFAKGVSKASKLAGKDIEAELADCLAIAARLLSAIDSFLDALDVSHGPPSPAAKPPQLRVGWKNPL
jgi:hypothetical protein